MSPPYPLPESARTEVRPGAARLFVAACLVSLLAVPAAQHLLPSGDEWGLRAGPFAGFAAALVEVWPQASDGSAGGVKALWQANRRIQQSLDDLERGLESSSLLQEQLLPDVQWLLAAYGGVGNETVYLGDAGWLYLRTGCDYLTGPPFLDPEVLRRRRLDAPAWRPPPQGDPRPALLDLGRQLAARGIHLLVLPVPTKAMIHPGPLAPRLAARTDRPRLHNPSFDAWRGELEAHGITVVDPAPILLRELRETGREQYLRTDSHWSPAAVDAVARALAERIRELELPFAGPLVDRRRQPVRLEGVGDLERGLRLPAWQKLYAPQEVELQQVHTGRERAEILLVGDSFSNVYSRPELGWGRSAGLPEQLSHHLRRPVDRLALNDGGATGSRRRLAEDMAAGRDLLAGKRLVIYQFAVRELAAGDWQTVRLP